MLATLLLGTAWASPGYPGEIQTDLGAGCVPQCTICHATNSGGAGTVVQDFGMAMQDRGLTGGSDYTALATALDAMTSDGVDSDGDGTIDTDELAGGTDPNPDGVAFCDVVTPNYGCFNTAASPASAVAVAAGLLAVGLARRR
jgi:hypothetical protein